MCPLCSLQVSIYLADRAHPAYGVVRVIVTDADDRDNSLTFLDSDGQVASNTGRRRPNHAGGWAGGQAGGRAMKGGGVVLAGCRRV